jgi:hypothetical protein
VGRGYIPNFQVGKGEDMRSAESSLIGEEEAEERPHSDEDLCRTASRVSEDDEKLKTFIVEKED